MYKLSLKYLQSKRIPDQITGAGVTVYSMFQSLRYLLAFTPETNQKYLIRTKV